MFRMPYECWIEEMRKSMSPPSLKLLDPSIAALHRHHRVVGRLIGREIRGTACKWTYQERGLETKLNDSDSADRPILALNKPKTKIATWLLVTYRARESRSAFYSSNSEGELSHLSNLAP